MAIDKGIFWGFPSWGAPNFRFPDWTLKIISIGETRSSFVEYILNQLVEVSEKNENLIQWLFTYVCQFQPDDRFQKNCFATSQKSS